MSIYYTGLGSNNRIYFSEAEFHQIMIREFFDKPEMRITLEMLRTVLPERNWPPEYALFTLDQWIDFVGATRINNT